MALFKTLFGSSGQGGGVGREYRDIGARVNALEADIAQFTLEKLREQADALRASLRKGKTLQDAMAEVFALTREAAKRTLGQRHFDVQVIGGAVLHEGKIAEMKTGEGKTLAATLPVVLNALEGKGVHVVTVNDYLAKRDTVWMGQIYHALGLSIGCITHEASYLYDPTYIQERGQGRGNPKSQIPNPKQVPNSNEQNSKRDEIRDALGAFHVENSYLRPVSRKEAYAADITYGTNNEFGFDYLRDNMAYRLDQQVQRGQHFAIIDEIDSVLIDEARTPLIISAPDQESSKWYQEFARLVPRLQADGDYEVDEKLKAVTLTDGGVDKVERLLGAKDIYQEKGIKYLHHLEQALRAQVLFARDKDYVVRNGQVVIVDEFTGRLLEGRRYSGGLHQALEAKEGVQVQPESITLASVTFQNYFRLYGKLAGMTGTATTSQEEFYEVYGLEVAQIPTNMPMVRSDLPDRVYKTEEAKFRAIANEVAACHSQGRPVLVGTVSIAKNEAVSRLLQREGVPHEVLNAKNHEQEGAVIAQAGRRGQVTVATNMAGRGVDIILGGNPPDEKEAQEVRQAGGLHVIGTDRHEARRIDNQLRGRAGRQGDPGSTQFAVSLQDDIVRIFGGERIKGIMDRFHLPEDQPIESGMVSKAIESAQSKVEGFNFDARKHLLEYDTVLNKHREVVYKKRREFLELGEQNALRPVFAELLERRGTGTLEYEKKERELGEEKMREAEKMVALRVIDSLWVEHLENMEQLRDSVRLRAYGQQDPLLEYKNEGHKMFQDFTARMEEFMANSIVRVQVAPAHAHPVQQAGNPHAHRAATGKKVGRNDPCPCGSGLKYKRCGLIGAPEHKP